MNLLPLKNRGAGKTGRATHPQPRGPDRVVNKSAVGNAQRDRPQFPNVTPGFIGVLSPSCLNAKVRPARISLTG
jgi:hypothetical protein